MLRERRKSLGIPCHALAAQAGLHHTLVYRIESGQTPDPSWSTVCRIAAVLGLSLDSLLAEKSNSAS